MFKRRDIVLLKDGSYAFVESVDADGDIIEVVILSDRQVEYLKSIGSII